MRPVAGMLRSPVVPAGALALALLLVASNGRPGAARPQTSSTAAIVASGPPLATAPPRGTPQASPVPASVMVFQDIAFGTPDRGWAVGPATVAHQLVQDLRSGGYAVLDGSGPPLSFSRVALAGFSAGGAIAQAEAYSFADIDALAVLAYADQYFTDLMGATFSQALDVCAGGGQLSEGPGTPAGYAYFGQTDRQYVAAVFHDADPSVVSAATALRDRDPCGDDGSFSQAVGTDQARLGDIRVPVFLAYGLSDALFQPCAGADQYQRFTGSNDVTMVSLANTGHLLMLERSAPQLRSAVSDWLSRRGL